MPLRAAVANRATPSIWISDDLLQSTWRRFEGLHLATCRRHVSHVPGPLEAQRRLAKRRMNIRCDAPPVGNLPGPVPFFPSLTWQGRQQQPRWSWEPSEKQSGVHDPGLNDLPSWPPGKTDRKSVADVELDAALESFGANAEVAGYNSFSEEDFMRHLDTISDLFELKRLFYEIRASSLDVVNCSILAFRRLLSQDHIFHVSDLLRFLEDPILNHAPGLNLKRMMKHFANKPLNPFYCSEVVDMFENAILQGDIVINPKHTEFNTDKRWDPAMIDFAKFVFKSYDSADVQAISDALKQIFRALTSVNAVEGITATPTDRGDILSLVIELLPDPKALGIAMQLLRKARSSYGKCEQEYQRHRVATIAYHAILSHLNEPKESVDNSFCPSLLKFLNDLSPKMAHHWTIAITTILTKEAKSANILLKSVYGRRGKKASHSQWLETWLATIRSCCHVEQGSEKTTWDTVYDILSKEFKPMDMPEHLNSLEPANICHVLLRHWEERDIILNQPQAPFEVYRSIKDDRSWAKSQEMQTALEIQGKFVSRFMKQNAAWSVALIQVLKESHRGCQATLESVLQLALYRRDFRTFETIATTVRRSLLISLKPQTAVIEAYVQAASRTRPRQAMRCFVLTENTSLGRCPDLVIDAAGSRIPWQLMVRLVRRKARIAPSQKLGVNEQRRQLIYRLARTLAVSQTRSARAAFRAVWDIFKFVRSNRVPIEWGMVDALITAGVARRMRDGKMPVKRTIARLLEMVAETKGEDEARRLDELIWENRDKLGLLSEA